MQPRRLYMDNAATSFPKPRQVMEAMTHYATNIGASAGRGAYAEAMESAGVIALSRKRLNMLFNGENPDHFVFTLNCTDALNIAIKGLIDPSQSNHAICSEMDHNSILRPLEALQRRGELEQTRVAINSKTGLIDPQDIRRAIKSNTRMIAIGHASNVTGTVQHIREIGKIAREAGVPLIVDAAQSAGHVPIDVQADCIDLLCAPGHKGLLGPLGTGFLYVRPGVEKILRTSRDGGTGSLSEDPIQPEFMPDKFEAGSHNAIGIAGLSEGVAWVLNQTVAQIAQHDREMIGTFIEGVQDVGAIKYFGPQGVRDRIGVFSVRVEGYDPQELAMILENHYGILTRAGIHCAPLIHRALGTIETGGTTRLSFGPFLSVQDVSYATDALAEIASTGVGSL